MSTYDGRSGWIWSQSYVARSLEWWFVGVTIPALLAFKLSKLLQIIHMTWHIYYIYMCQCIRSWILEYWNLSDKCSLLSHLRVNTYPDPHWNHYPTTGSWSLAGVAIVAPTWHLGWQVAGISRSPNDSETQRYHLISLIWFFRSGCFSLLKHISHTTCFELCLIIVPPAPKPRSYATLWACGHGTASSDGPGAGSASFQAKTVKTNHHLTQYI